MKKIMKSGGKKAPFPKATLLPMLATLVDAPFDEPGWTYEIKWDGYRAIAYMHKGKVDIRSRNNKPFSEKFYPLTEDLSAMKVDAVIDGEIIVENEKGMADFSALQNWRSEADGRLVFYAFDILWFDGKDVTMLPFIERHRLLEKIIGNKSKTIKLSQLIPNTGKKIFSKVQQLGLEGIIAKKEESIYQPGARSKNWLKIKTEKRQDVIIGGYTINEGTKKAFSALLLGIYENNEFVYFGSVGTGFDASMQHRLMKLLKPLERKKCPFNEVPDFNKPSRFRPDPPKAKGIWVKPEVVIEISYRELTPDGKLRHPSFKAIRHDKNAEEVTSEIPKKAKEIVNKKSGAGNLVSTPAPRERKSLLNPTEQTQVKTINGHDLKFTNLDKIFWPEEKYTKRDLINYYFQVAPFMLPHMKNRPQTLLRHPNGYKGKAFYQKDVTGKVPGWLETYQYYSEFDQREKNFLVCTNEASLLYIASMGCIEMNPWSSTIESPGHPDWCIIDLDPDKNSFEQVIKAAQVTKKILDSIGVDSYCKTSGSTGIHIYIPLGAKYTYEDSKEFARKIATLVHVETKSFTSIERLTGNRNGKMYVDFLQNRPQATLAAVYSARPKPGATVSMPLHWDEVRKGLKMKNFTIKNAIERVKSEGDLFKGVLGKGINLEKALKQIKKLYDR